LNHQFFAYLREKGANTNTSDVESVNAGIRGIPNETLKSYEVSAMNYDLLFLSNVYGKINKDDPSLKRNKNRLGPSRA
jgi:hypothetical protein